ncbi:glycerol-3-phosphate dehydrogenase/oxidase [Ferrimonas balearica]|uniref:glycerol-3-phosphate dehydrogenase/oxidase n=1 Tax=Ferrimonas balearica TaxID=44012 RepID=UPI001C9924AB|nr:glycerol-3-phosphate dehydrogenase/oxidase [Ferrimonas balearica]MBY5993909.1 glycerol-3-phosphate dehydrogenase/oxidase [Ferrimonas balearica]
MRSLTESVCQTRAQLADGQQWDLIVIGAGITGAGVARLAAQQGYRTLLLERGDLAGGTSNFSSKMVHGGLRYLGQGHFKLTRQAARARERLRQRWPDIITPLPYYLVHHKGRGPGPWPMRLVLWLYHRISGAAPAHTPRWLSPEALAARLPGFNLAPNKGANHYFDAVCDDSQLVLRTLEEAVCQGAALCHYTPVRRLLRESGQVTGVEIDHQGTPCRLKATLVVNATGVWADGLTPLPEGLTLRPLRGSHLVFDARDLPLPAALTLFHPQDGRVVFCYPWAGTTVLGTTDLDHLADKAAPARCSDQERDYLLAILPLLGVSQVPPILSSWSGLRPILAREGQNQAPSDASREHLIWDEPGLVSVTGGKLTTFVEMADEVMARAQAQGRLPAPAPQEDQVLTQQAHLDGNLIGNSLVHRHELVHWARHGAIHRLSDLLLRRTRLGWVLGQTLADYQTEIQRLCTPALEWSEARWQAQWQDYWQQWQAYHMEGPEDGR